LRQPYFKAKRLQPPQPQWLHDLARPPPTRRSLTTPPPLVRQDAGRGYAGTSRDDRTPTHGRYDTTPEYEDAARIAADILGSLSQPDTCTRADTTGVSSPGSVIDLADDSDPETIPYVRHFALDCLGRLRRVEEHHGHWFYVVDDYVTFKVHPQMSWSVHSPDLLEVASKMDFTRGKPGVFHTNSDMCWFVGPTGVITVFDEDDYNQCT
jgi:hypothetical protein